MWVPVVQVKRRETERQTEMRMHSHAYLKQREEEEKWVELEAYDSSTEAAEALRAQVPPSPPTVPPSPPTHCASLTTHSLCLPHHPRLLHGGGGGVARAGASLRRRGLLQGVCEEEAVATLDFAQGFAPIQSSVCLAYSDGKSCESDD